MKNKTIIFLLMVLFSSGLFGCGKEDDKKESKDTSTDRMEISHVQFFTSIFSTKGDNGGTALNMTIEPQVSFSRNFNSDEETKEISAIKVENVEVKEKYGDTKIIYPQHISGNSFNWYYGQLDFQPTPSEVKGEGDSKEYALTDQPIGEYADEVYREGGMVKFKVVFNNLENKDDEKVQSFGMNLLKEYGLEAKDLTNEIEFDLVIEFEDGKAARKNIKVDIPAEGITTTNYNIDNTDYEGDIF